ncbi:hypothetical protein B7P43_G18435 [Cryptotermes secundus]|uniref:Uncharacterized protein n=1 Tax=Cryptotermes secundus TaxID=105785 RepID=A0A2J7QGB3_9NEOP|nr:hypothetical protein B7P43_G18435 [Cryptotermes secundus]
MSYSRKTNVLLYGYQLCRTAITRTSCVKDRGVFFDSKLYFHNNVDFLYSECIRSITFRFSSLDCLHVLYLTLVRSKLEYASVAWNSITSADYAKLGCIQKKFASVCFYRYFPRSSYSYTSALERLRLHPLILRRHLLDALFFIQVYRGLKSCFSLLDNASLRVPTCHVRDFSTFSVRPSKRHCPSSRCALATNVVGKDLDKFADGAVSLNHILQACTKPFTVLFD